MKLYEFKEIEAPSGGETVVISPYAIMKYREK